MTNRSRHPLLKWNQRLKKLSRNNFLKLLRRVCLGHQDNDKIKECYTLLNPSRLKGTMYPFDAVIDLADSLSEQKYSDAWQHFQANQFASLIRKFPFSKDDTSYRPEEKAREKFFEAEHKCYRINQRFAARLRCKSKPAPYEYELDDMRKFISYVLGHAPMLKNIWNGCGFGPGASIGTHGNATNVWRKLSSHWSVSPGAYHFAFAAVMNHAQVREVIFPNAGGFTSCGLDYSPERGPFSKKVKLVAYNKISFVPKTAKTHRVIAVEPLLNSFVQKGVDEHMRLRLKRIGIDLSDQSRNSEFARLGSLPGAEDPFVTIDLSSASDSISIGLVKDVLPPEWYDFLNAIRSKSFLLDGEIRQYNKFCSMGNGFCFPLETLLFVAACKACNAGRPGKDFLVYGDDIVLRQSKSMKLIKLLAYMGFKTNKGKTFLEGPFRESCGKDWFGGIDVRPYTLDFQLDSIQSFFKFLNGAQASEYRKIFFSNVRPHMINMVPNKFRFFRPYPGPEDTGIDSVQDEFLTSPHCSYRFHDGSGAWRWKELISRSVADRYRPSLDNAYALVYAALVGSASDQPFALRRKTKTKVRLISHPGATSLWLPQTN